MFSASSNNMGPLTLMLDLLLNPGVDGVFVSYPASFSKSGLIIC